jgi:hypothetical protein
MDNLPMHTLYDSETYCVTHMLANAVAADVPADELKEGEQLLIVPRLARHGFEIVDKRANKEVYLDGSWAPDPVLPRPPGPGACGFGLFAGTQRQH